MATYYGVNHTKAFQTVPAVKVDVSDWGGRIRVLSDSFTSEGAIAINEKVYMGRLPKGAKVIEVILASTDHGTAGDADVGYEYVNSADGSADLDAFLAAADVNAAAVTHVMSAKANMIGFQKEMAGEAYVVISLPEATTAAGTFKLSVFYVVD